MKRRRDEFFMTEKLSHGLLDFPHLFPVSIGGQLPELLLLPPSLSQQADGNSSTGTWHDDDRAQQWLRKVGDKVSIDGPLVVLLALNDGSDEQPSSEPSFYYYYYYYRHLTAPVLLTLLRDNFGPTNVTLLNSSSNARGMRTDRRVFLKPSDNAKFIPNAIWICFLPQTLLFQFSPCQSHVQTASSLWRLADIMFVVVFVAKPP